MGHSNAPRNFPPIIARNARLHVFAFPEIKRREVSIWQLFDKRVVACGGLDARSGWVHDEPIAVGLAGLTQPVDIFLVSHDKRPLMFVSGFMPCTTDSHARVKT